MTSELEIKTEQTTDEFFALLEQEELRRTNPKKFRQLPQFKSMNDLIDLYEIRNPQDGEVVTGTYQGKFDGQHVFNVSGYKDDVRVDSRPGEDKYLKNTQIGDVIDILVTEVDNDDYHINGSISAIYESRAHTKLKALEEGLSVEALIKSMNPAGYEVEILHEGVTLSAFMPNTLAGINKLHNPESIVGRNFLVMIESYSNQEGTYIVSRRKYLKTLIPEAREQLESNVIYEGHVTGTTPFGIFVEFNDCLTGMIHKVNVDPDWQDRIEEIKPGFTIQFYVKEIAREKIILTQILRESLWDNIKIGQTIRGKVRDNKQFGCLVLLDDETMGLIHTSELEKIGKKFQPEQEIDVKVLAIDRSSRKIFLTA